MASTRPPAVLVTGAARRIGAAIARALHERGAVVAIHCRHSKQDADILAAKLNSERAHSAIVFEADLGEAEACADLVTRVAKYFGHLDGLVNNASTFFATPLGSIEGAHWKELMSANVKAPLFLSQAAAPHLRQTQGAIINIVDIHADRPMKDFVVYSVAKAALAGLTRSLAIELAPEVRVNGVSPGAIAWPDDGQHFSDDEKARIIATTPLARVGTPDDIAKATCALMLDTPFVTGQILAVDGGRSVFL